MAEATFLLGIPPNSKLSICKYVCIVQIPKNGLTCMLFSGPLRSVLSVMFSLSPSPFIQVGMELPTSTKSFCPYST